MTTAIHRRNRAKLMAEMHRIQRRRIARKLRPLDTVDLMDIAIETLRNKRRSK